MIIDPVVHQNMVDQLVYTILMDLLKEKWK